MGVRAGQNRGSRQIDLFNSVGDLFSLSGPVLENDVCHVSGDATHEQLILTNAFPPKVRDENSKPMRKEDRLTTLSSAIILLSSRKDKIHPLSYYLNVIYYKI